MTVPGAKLVDGTWLPESEHHMVAWMRKEQQMRGGRSCYQAHKLDMAMRLCRSDRRRVAVDCGAHVGTWSMLLVWQFRHVVAFEPSARADIFPHNMPAPNWTLHRVALGDRAGKVAMQEFPDSTGGCHVIAGAEGDVPLRTLDSFDLKDVDFVKIDVEGQELPLVRGAVETIKRCRPVVLVEQKGWNDKHVRDNNKDAATFLEGLGMRLAAQYSGDLVYCFG